MTLHYKLVKDQIVQVLKMMRSSINYEFCESRDFLVDHPARMLQLEGYLVDMTTRRATKRAFEFSGRSVNAQNLDSVVKGYGPHPGAGFVFKYRRSDTDHFTAFKDILERDEPNELEKPPKPMLLMLFIM